MNANKCVQRAVDLLYAMCDRTNSEEIVLEMLGYLETADYSIREEMVIASPHSLFLSLSLSYHPLAIILSLSVGLVYGYHSRFLRLG